MHIAENQRDTQSEFRHGDKVKTTWSRGTVAVVKGAYAYIVYDGLSPLGDWHDVEALTKLPKGA
jgi:hypothetical protein